MRKIKKVYQLKLKTIKEFNVANEDELYEQVMSWPKVDKEWDKGWKRIEPKKNISMITVEETKKSMENDIRAIKPFRAYKKGQVKK